jgi:hypothetical protein
MLMLNIHEWFLLKAPGYIVPCQNTGSSYHIGILLYPGESRGNMNHHENFKSHYNFGYWPA